MVHFTAKMKRQCLMEIDGREQRSVGLTVVGGVGPSGRGLAGRASLLDARVRGDGREDGDGRVVPVRVPGKEGNGMRVGELPELTVGRDCGPEPVAVALLA